MKDLRVTWLYVFTECKNNEGGKGKRYNDKNNETIYFKRRILCVLFLI